jgi:hypothetical protein
VKETASFPPLNWLEEIGFECVLHSNGLVRSVLPERKISLLWSPLGLSNTETEGKFNFCIHEDIWFCYPEAVKTRIHSLLGTNKRVHGRQCKVHRIDKAQAEHFLNHYHTGGFVTGYYKFGLFYKNELMACATFSKKRRFLTDTQSLVSAELLRFAVKDGFYVAGGLHKLIVAFMEEAGVNHLMTYADKEWTKGDSYEKVGFVKTGESPPLSFCVNPNTMRRKLHTSSPVSCPDDGIAVQNQGNIKFVLMT